MPHHTSYANRRWRAVSEQWLRQYPLCVVCVCMGRVNRGAVDYQSDKQRNLIVDHIQPHKDDATLFWDQSNWQTLCRMPCHDRIKQSHEMRGRGTEEWWSMLRRWIVERKAGEHVEAMRRWLPKHVNQKLLI